MKTKSTQSATSKKLRKRSTWTEAGAQKMIDMLKAAPASITEEVIDAIEAAHRQDTFGPARRAALIILRDTGAALIDKIEHADPKQALAVAVFYEHQMKYLSVLRELTQLIESATARTMLALCYRPDCDAIRSEAVAEVTKEARS